MCYVYSGEELAVKGYRWLSDGVILVPQNSPQAVVSKMTPRVRLEEQGRAPHRGTVGRVQSPWSARIIISDDFSLPSD